MAVTKSQKGLRTFCSELVSDVERWIEELRIHGIRPTLGHGMIHKCAALVEHIVLRCCEIYLHETGEDGLRALKRIRADKGLEKLTLGQLIRFVREVVPLMQRNGVMGDVNDATWSKFDTVLQMRNAFMHPSEVREDASLWIEYLEASKALTETPVVRVASEIDEREACQ